jgi:hypothetical protein
MWTRAMVISLSILFCSLQTSLAECNQTDVVLQTKCQFYDAVRSQNVRNMTYSYKTGLVDINEKIIKGDIYYYMYGVFGDYFRFIYFP